MSEMVTDQMESFTSPQLTPVAFSPYSSTVGKTGGFVVCGDLGSEGLSDPFIYFETEATAREFKRLADLHGGYVQRKIVRAERGP